MEQGSAQARAEWNYTALLLALLAGLVLQGLILTCLCIEGDIKMRIAVGADVLVFVRYLVARTRHETGKGWLFYALLPFLIIPVAELAVRFAAPR